MSTQITGEQLIAVEEMARVDESVVRAAMSRIPAGWRMIARNPGGGAFVRNSTQVLFSVARYDDGNIWIHASACCRTGTGGFRLPDWEELKRVKNDFIGRDRWAYQVFPDESHYVNHNAYVLHLFALMENRPALPDFTWGLGTL